MRRTGIIRAAERRDDSLVFGAEAGGRPREYEVVWVCRWNQYVVFYSNALI